MRLILIIILLILLLGALPTWPYSFGWGYYPSGGRIAINFGWEKSLASVQLVECKIEDLHGFPD
ncbi:MAG TPA: DUF3309 domain-containing protein [Candidatus Udaeobacter sp.]|nr:DUF3309 domain-containing protein [Candidatus Udaeobacter sp.]